MRRFRILFVVFALVLLAPILLLVQRAMQSVGVERAMRHQLVAERVFDEMERSLSRFLEPEEQRPFEGYTVVVPAGAVPFLIGYFQIDPDNRIHTLPAPQTPAGPATAGLIEELVARTWGRSGTDQPAAAARAAQLPGTTITLGKDDLAEPRRSAPQAAAPANESNEVSAFDALRSLNKAASERLDRQRKKEGGAPESGQGLQLDERDFAAKARIEDTASALDRTNLAPMTGQLIDSHRLLLHRTVLHGGQGYRQGVLLDVDRLCTWIRQQALGDEQLGAYAGLSCAASPAVGAPSGGAAYTYQHRFADPFDGLTARLTLQPLPGVAGVAYVYALSMLLLATATLGLGALYRMVSVVVRYAEQRGNFVAAVSHELKTPLTAIRMYGEMLRDGMVPSEQKRQEYYRHITGESERLTRLINNVLELSRLEKGNRQMALTVGAVGPVLHEVAALLRPHLQAEGYELAVDIDDQAPEVRFDRDALIQVLSNLIDNAVKYARDATDRRIELACRAEGGRLLVTIRDHGNGVPPHQLRKIFEPFYRGESELTRRNQGTGIGLALVRSLAGRMGAEITARNRDDGGLEVTLSVEIPEKRPI